MSAENWWSRRADESEQDWANRIEDHNPSEAEEVWAANMRARAAKRGEGVA